MQDSNVQAKTKGQTKVNTQAKADVSTGTIVAASAVSAIIGLWAVACFVGGMVASGGPIAMIKSFISAVSGI